MTASETNADKFALLFSTDWFRPHWELTGFVPKPEAADVFQQNMRELVADFMWGEGNYWLINFSDARLDRTRASFLEALERSRADGGNIELIRALVLGGDTRDAFAEVSMNFWTDYETMTDHIRRGPILDTEWDRKVVLFTPDLPSLLQDFVLVEVMRVA